MERIGKQRPHWGRRALVLALVGGFIGWFVAYVGLLVLVQAYVRREAGPYSSGGPIDPELDAAFMLGALIYGAPCGVALGLVIWAVWLLVCRGAASETSPHRGAT